MIRSARTLFATLAAVLAFAAFAQSETRFDLYDDTGRVVGIGKIEVESDVTDVEVDLLRGFEGFVSVLVPGADGVNVAYDGFIAADGSLTVTVDGAFLDLATFLARFGDDPRIDLEYEDRFGDEDGIGDDGDRDDDRSREDDDADDDDRDDGDDRDDDDRSRDEDDDGDDAADDGSDDGRSDDDDAGDDDSDDGRSDDDDAGDDGSDDDSDDDDADDDASDDDDTNDDSDDDDADDD